MPPRAKAAQSPRAGRTARSGLTVVGKSASGKLTMSQVVRMAPMQRIALIKQGLPPGLVLVLAESLGVTKERLYDTVGVARATIDRKVREEKPLSPAESERFVALMQIVEQAEQIVRESGDPELTGDFDAYRWVATFLETPHPALGGSTPGALMELAEGREIVSRLIARMQTGAYA